MTRIIGPMPNGMASISSGHMVPIRSAKPCGVISAIIASKTAHCLLHLGVGVREVIAQRRRGEARQVHDLHGHLLLVRADPELELAAGAERQHLARARLHRLFQARLCRSRPPPAGP